MTAQPARPAHPRRRFTPRRLALWAICLLIGAAVAGEIGSRYILGLGDPPLFMLDPEIEYLLVPSQRCRRFGHDYVVNKWAMRSGEFGAKKVLDEYRVMVIGDSVVNGGGKIDQGMLATSRLGEGQWWKAFPPGKAPKLVVGNISAPSWGPPNHLAYAKKLGLFDADLVIIVLNSDDVDDVPGLEYIGSAWPQKKPVLALQELITVYVWKAACKAMGRPFEPPPPPHTTTHDQDVELCRKSFTELVELARSKGAKVALVQYLKKSELRSQPQSGYTTINTWAKAASVPIFSTADLFRAAINDPAAPDPYLPGDDIHASAKGQQLLGSLFGEVVQNAQKQP